MFALRERRRLQNARQQSQRTQFRIPESTDEFSQHCGRPSEIYFTEIQNEASTLHENNFKQICLTDVSVASSTTLYKEVIFEQSEHSDKTAMVSEIIFELMVQIEQP